MRTLIDQLSLMAHPMTSWVMPEHALIPLALNATNPLVKPALQDHESRLSRKFSRFSQAAIPSLGAASILTLPATALAGQGTVSPEVQHAIDTATLVPLSVSHGGFSTERIGYGSVTEQDYLLYQFAHAHLKDLSRQEIETIVSHIDYQTLQGDLLAEYAAAHISDPVVAVDSTGSAVTGETTDLTQQQAATSLPDNGVQTIIALASNVGKDEVHDGQYLRDTIVRDHFDLHYAEYSPAEVVSVSELIHDGMKYQIAISYGDAYTAGKITGHPAQGIEELTTILKSIEPDAVSNGQYVRDTIVKNYFNTHGYALTLDQVETLSSYAHDSTRLSMLKTYGEWFAQGKVTAGQDVKTAETLAQSEPLSPVEWSTAEYAMAGGSLIVPTLIAGVVLYKLSARFRIIMQVGGGILALPYTVPRDAVEKFRFKRETRRAEKAKLREKETADKEKQRLRDATLREIYAWDDETDDVKRDKLVTLIPLLMEIPDRDERRKALQETAFSGLRSITEAHYVKPVLQALARELGQAAKWRRDDAAFALKHFFTGHPLSAEDKLRLMEETLVVPVNATEDAKHDLAAWKSHWEELLAKLGNHKTADDEDAVKKAALARAQSLAQHG